MKLYYFNDFEKKASPWAHHDGQLDITEDRQFQITSYGEDSGTIAEFELDNVTCNVNFSINRDQLPATTPVIFRVENADGETIHTQNILTSGFVQATFTLPTAGNYRFILSTTAEGLPFFIDDFYIYYLGGANSNNFVSLFEPEVLNFSDFYPFGMLVPNRHASSNSYRYGFGYTNLAGMKQ